MPKTKSGRRQARVQKRGPVVPRQVLTKKKTPQRPDTGVKTEEEEEKKEARKSFYLTVIGEENDKSQHLNLGTDRSKAYITARGAAILTLEQVANKTNDPLLRISKTEVADLVATKTTRDVLEMACMKVIEY